MTDRRGSVVRDAQAVRAHMTDDEREAISQLFDLARQTGDIEHDHRVVLVACRNFLGYIEMALHDGAFETSIDWFVRDTSSELDELGRSAPALAAFAAEYRALQARCVAAYRRVVTG